MAGLIRKDNGDFNEDVFHMHSPSRGRHGEDRVDEKILQGCGMGQHDPGGTEFELCGFPR